MIEAEFRKTSDLFRGRFSKEDLIKIGFPQKWRIKKIKNVCNLARSGIKSDDVEFIIGFLEKKKQFNIEDWEDGLLFLNLFLLQESILSNFRTISVE